MHLSTFINQKSYEKVVYNVHRYFITFIPTIIFLALLLAVPVGLYYMVMALFPGLLIGAISYPLLVLAAATYYLFIALVFYSNFLDFYLDLLVITNDRLVDVEQTGLFSRVVSEVDLYKVQDVTSEIKGFFPSMFNYGNLYIQTAGAMEKFNIYNVHNPERLRQAILDLAEGDRKYHLSVLESSAREERGGV